MTTTALDNIQSVADGQEDKMKPTDIKLTTRARCFRGANGGVGILDEYQFLVDAPDGTVSVYDDVAGHYTIHHGMTAREESRVRNLAKLAAPSQFGVKVKIQHQ